MLELVVHIGAGKTGSSSIQQTLRKNCTDSESRGVVYLGTMLQMVPGALQYNWCQWGAPQNFFDSEDPDRVDEEVLLVLLDQMRRLTAARIDRAVWSNEAFLVQNARVLRILGRLAEEASVSVRPIVYVRRHDKRTESAYAELAIKSKRYRGPIRSFEEWAGSHAVAYSKNLNLWQRAFPALEIYNYDAVGDVAQHFCDVIGLMGIDTVRANEPLSLPLLAAWAVFNNGSPNPTWATDFSRIAELLKIMPEAMPLVPAMDQLMPSQVSLMKLQIMYRDDFEAVNNMLKEQGRPPLEFDTPQPKFSDSLTPWETERLLWSAVFSLQQQILELKSKLEGN
jgi:hypothetical protein